MKSVRKRMAGLTAIIMSLLLVLEALPFAYAAAFGYEMKNVLSETPDERVFVYEFDKSAPNKMGKEAFLVAGPHGGSSEKKILTDGSMSSFSTTSITTETDNKDKRTVGWFVIDAGQTYPVSSVVLDLCHDWGAEDLVVQLSVFLCSRNGPLHSRDGKHRGQRADAGIHHSGRNKSEFSRIQHDAQNAQRSRSRYVQCDGRNLFRLHRHCAFHRL